MEAKDIIAYLKNYDGPEVKLMEVCGTHTASIFKSGIRSLISSKIKLISGPGCPVCVTPTAFIDKVVSYAMMDNHVVMSFGDMLKVPGTEGSLSDAKGRGAKVEIMYSPLDAVAKAETNPQITYVIAAVGFETTAPTYALALMQAKKKNIKNIKLVTALKASIPAISWICENEKGVDGYICPGHVSVITGSKVYEELAQKYDKPFVVAGFEPEHVLVTIYEIMKQIESRELEPSKARNLYTNAVKFEGNLKAQKLTEDFFEVGPATWRGLGIIQDSGLYLRKEFEEYEGGSRGLDSDMKLPKSCRCGEVIVGRINPNECPMFAKTCFPENPYGPCMVSAEGACGIWFRNTI